MTNGRGRLWLKIINGEPHLTAIAINGKEGIKNGLASAAILTGAKAAHSAGAQAAHTAGTAGAPASLTGSSPADAMVPRHLLLPPAEAMV
jgi:hypothetical protein